VPVQKGAKAKAQIAWAEKNGALDKVV